MRVLFITGSLPPVSCGVGDYTDALLRALATSPGMELGVLTAASVVRAMSRDQSPRAYQVLAPVAGWGLRDAVRMFRTIRAWRPDVVHLQYPTQGYADGWLASLAVPLAAMSGAKVVRTWHEGFHTRQGVRLLVQSFSRGPAVVVRPDFAERVSHRLEPLIRKRRQELIIGASAIPRSILDDEALSVCRHDLLGGARRLFVFFGFLYPAKGVERLLAAANPTTDRVVICGEDGVDAPYTAKLKALVAGGQWQGHAAMLGRQPEAVIADLLAAADAAVFPFLSGGGVWNSSIHAATTQGTPVVTTTAGAPGVSANGLIRYVPALDDARLRAALDEVPVWRADRRPPPVDEWQRIATAHCELYRGELGMTATDVAG